VKKSLELILADNDPKREEFKQMVKQINDKAMAQVQTELYFGLSFLTILTFGWLLLPAPPYLLLSPP